MHASTTRTGPAAIFLINNVAYARRELTESPVADYLGEGGEAELNKRMRAAKAQYLIVWSPLIAALMDAGDDKGGFGLGAVKSALPGQQAGAERREVKDRSVPSRAARDGRLNPHDRTGLAGSTTRLKRSNRCTRSPGSSRGRWTCGTG